MPSTRGTENQQGIKEKKTTAKTDGREGHVYEIDPSMLLIYLLAANYIQAMFYHLLTH
jgi:hypothetical protein